MNQKLLDKKKELSKCCNAPIEKLNDWGAEYMGCSKCFSAQSLNKNKHKELKCIEDLIKTGWKVLYFKIKGDNLDVVGENGVQLLNYFEDTLTQQRTEILEEILNLECLKEDKFRSVNQGLGCQNARQEIENQLREEIKEEIKKIID